MNRRFQYSEALAKGGHHTGPVDGLARSVALEPDESQLPALFARLETEAKQLPWYWDEDYTAVALQDEASRVDSTARRGAMLAAALRYARWCASCATAGGEGVARSVPVRALRALLPGETGNPSCIRTISL